MKEANINPNAIAVFFWLYISIEMILGDKITITAFDESTFIIFQKIVLNLFVALWVYFDAKKHDFDGQRRSVYAATAVIISEIVLPVYLVKSRGWHGAGKTVLRFIAYLLICGFSLALIEAIFG